MNFDEQQPTNGTHDKRRHIKNVLLAVFASVFIMCVVIGSVSLKAEKKKIEQTTAREEQEEGREEENVSVEESVAYEENLDEKMISSSELALEIKEEYKQAENYEYTYVEPIEGLERDGAIEVTLNYNPEDLGVEYWTEIYGIYQNPELTQMVVPNYSWDAEKKTLTMNPPTYGINRIGTGQLSTDTVNKYSHSTTKLFDKGDGADWGNLGVLYMVCYYDAETGEPLEHPEVSVITCKGELGAFPVMEYSVLEDGRPEFSWTEVEGAEEYIICEVEYTAEKGYGIAMHAIANTPDTSWTVQQPIYERFASVNKEFKTYTLSQDAWGNEAQYEYYKEDYEPGTVVPFDAERERGICVIAVNQEGTSMMSNVFLYSEIAPNLPSELAVNAEKENNFVTQCETIDELPAYDYVVMCDGITNRKMIDYKTEEASVRTEKIFYADGTGEDALCLEIPYVIEGTPFAYSVKVINYDETNLDNDLQFLHEREESIRKKSGDISLQANVPAEEAEAETEIYQRDEELEVFASSALSEYLAENMLSGVEYIDISSFPEAKSQEILEDALFEANYQNPMIMGISGYKIFTNMDIVYVLYDNEKEVCRQKQDEVQEQVDKIISEIITEGMTDAEKEMAINQYLCDTIVYDDDALLNAEENAFMFVDEEYIDAFNAYGALVKGKCVCAGYSAAFKLLADAAGLESIVVTGLLEGESPHAWNKVKIEEQWQIIDVTNNDGSYIANALFNLPEQVGDRVLVEDKDFMVDSKIGDYEGGGEDFEYYHINDRYFSVQEISEKLAEELQTNKVVALRTEYELNDDQFYEIASAIYTIMGDEVELYGYHWLGVIYLTTESF